MSAKSSQPWIASARLDGVFIIAPAFISLVLAFFLSRESQYGTSMPDYAWVALVLLIDVSHVYSTLYRTYFDQITFQQKRGLLTTAPLLAFVGGVLLYSINGLFFWRVLAYLAVFHFVRQQYGFLRIYSRKERFPAWYARLDTAVIYAATLYPILYWHLTAPKHFNWLIENDFLYFQSDLLLWVSTWTYYGILAAYLLKEGWMILRYRYWNLPKTGIIMGTLTSWYFGIVYFNGDLAFTLLNVVAHGIPYMALVWIFHRKQAGHAVKTSSTGFWRKVAASFGLPVFLGSLLLLAYFEEGLWDALVWHDHPELFTLFRFLPSLRTDYLLAFVVPLLALPQATHYILDGFIWKLSSDDGWKETVLKKQA
jgi:hypothetical protein